MRGVLTPVRVLRATRSSRRGIVAASRYSSALARKPSGGAGSSMRSTSRPCAAIALTYCESGRCTNGSTTPGASSSIVTSTGRYGPTRQYCSSRMWSITQPLFGACSNGWFRRNTNRPPGASTRAISAIGGLVIGRCARTRGTRPRRRTTRRRTAAARRPRAGRRGPPAALGRDLRAARASGRHRRRARRRARAASRATWPSPVPTSTHAPRAGEALAPRAGGSAPRTRDRRRR